MNIYFLNSSYYIKCLLFPLKVANETLFELFIDVFRVFQNEYYLILVLQIGK